MKDYKCHCGSLYWGLVMPKKCYVCKCDMHKAKQVEMIDWEKELLS